MEGDSGQGAGATGPGRFSPSRKAKEAYSVFGGIWWKAVNCAAGTSKERAVYTVYILHNSRIVVDKEFKCAEVDYVVHDDVDVEITAKGRML
jgi:hypothetical protein